MSALPDWVPADAWAGYIEMRKKIKKPMTDRATVLAVGVLIKLRDAGNEPGAVLDQSTMNSWQGLFEVKQERRATSRENNSIAMSRLGKFGQATANNAQDWLEGN